MRMSSGASGGPDGLPNAGKVGKQEEAPGPGSSAKAGASDESPAPAGTAVPSDQGAAPYASEAPAPGEAKKRFLLRLDPLVYAALEKWASDEFRSVNSQMEFLLKAELKRAGRWGNSSKG